MTTRRRFLKLAANGGAAVYFSPKLGFWTRVAAQIPGGTLPPEVIREVCHPAGHSSGDAQGGEQSDG